MITKVDKNLAQQIVNTVQNICGHNINFIDETGTIFASTNDERIGDFHEIGFQVAHLGETIEVTVDNNFQETQQGVNIPIFHNGTFIAIIGISGEPEKVRKYAHLAIRITKLLIREQEMQTYSRSQKEKMNYVASALIKSDFTNKDYLLQCLKEMEIEKTQEVRAVVIKFNKKYNLENVSLIEQKLFQLFSSIQVALYYHNYPNEYIAVINEHSTTFSIQNITSFYQ